MRSESGNSRFERARFIVMLHKEDIQRGLRKIDALAKEAGVVVDLSTYGGAALALTFDTRRVTRDVDILCDLMLVRRLPAWHGNIGKRLVRAPKVVVRDSGIHHALLELESLEVVLGHPVAGASWEGFVIEQILAAVPQAEASFYRTAHGPEADLVLHLRNGGAADIAHADHQDLVGWVGSRKEHAVVGRSDMAPACQFESGASALALYPYHRWNAIQGCLSNSACMVDAKRANSLSFFWVSR